MAKLNWPPFQSHVSGVKIALSVVAFDVSGFRWPMPPPEKEIAEEPAPV